ncbi:HdeD family acid-resistance protein [Frondihabitans cladoniiphilus]|uniref:HdeD family acid-resistance protein n=1 Tax=Frondihabitans cladoniiphilus TaxID=715785 RepID=A0ABP8VI46_9MICO
MTGTPPFGTTSLRGARTPVLVAAIVAIVLGAIALFFPRASLVTIAILFGISLLVIGLFRLFVAIRATALPTGVRVLTGVLAALIIIAALLCLFDPFQSLSLLGVVIGVGWIFEGVTGLIHARSGGLGLGLVAGVVAIVAGIVMLFLPILALSAFVIVAGIILIVVGITMLLHLPRRA